MTTVIRFSSLGDVVLTAAITGALGEVAFRTLPRYADLVRRFPGVIRVLDPDEAPIGGAVIDLHNNLRSRRFSADRRLAREDWRRRARVWFKGRPATPLVERYARAAGVSAAVPPWLTRAERGNVLLLAPGAAHATKRWPWWGELAAAWDGPVRALGGPADEAWIRRLGGVAEDGFERTLAAMDGGAVLVAGDTGLLHLGVAVGLPVVGLFGPTTSADGFFHHPGSTPAWAVESPLACRPCSRFGGEHCPVGDHLCMRGLGVDRVLAAAREAAGR
jgi:ADP-heptose:LPS heptosyltransferase